MRRDRDSELGNRTERYLKSDKTEEKEYISIFENDTRKLKKMDYSDESKLTVVVSLNHEYIFILEIKKKEAKIQNR